MEISPALLAVFGLLLALWTAGAVWVMLRASTREQKSAAARKAAQRLSRLIEEGPAIPLLVGPMDGSRRPSDWLAGSASIACPNILASSRAATGAD